MYKRGVIDDDHQRLLKQPLSIISVTAKRSSVSEISGRRLLIELSPYRQCIRICRLITPIQLIPVFTLLSRLIICKGSVFSIGYIANITYEIHDLMVAKQLMYLTTRALRLPFQTHDEIHHLS